MIDRNFIVASRDEREDFRLTATMLEELLIDHSHLAAIALKYGVKREDLLFYLRRFVSELSTAIERDEFMHNFVPNKPIDIALEAIAKMKPKKNRKKSP